MRFFTKRNNPHCSYSCNSSILKIIPGGAKYFCTVIVRLICTHVHITNVCWATTCSNSFNDFLFLLKKRQKKHQAIHQRRRRARQNRCTNAGTSEGFSTMPSTSPCQHGSTLRPHGAVGYFWVGGFFFFLSCVFFISHCTTCKVGC